jgi:hypothetical protein
MNTTKSEYVYMCLLALGIVFIIGMSVVTLIDRKISNISINVPKIIVPKSNVTIKLSKQCIDKPYEIEQNIIEEFTPMNNLVTE